MSRAVFLVGKLVGSEFIVACGWGASDQWNSVGEYTALIKATIHWEKGRPETGTKANITPVKAANPIMGHFKITGRGRR